MSTKRKYPTSSPIPRAAHLNGWTLGALADEIGGDRQQTLRLLRRAVERGEVARVESAGRVLWSEVPRQDLGGRRRAKSPPPPVLGVTAATFAREMGVDPGKALRLLTEAMNRGAVARIRTGGRELWARVGGGQINELPAAARPPIPTNGRNER